MKTDEVSEAKQLAEIIKATWAKYRRQQLVCDLKYHRLTSLRVIDSAIKRV